MIKVNYTGPRTVALEKWEANRAYDNKQYIYIVSSDADEYVRIDKLTGRVSISDMKAARSDFEAVEVNLEISVKA